LPSKSGSEKPFLDLTVTQDGNAALATSTDRSLTMYDLRSPALIARSATFVHPSTPSCVVISEANSSHVATGGYDGIVRVWDLRSTKDPIAFFKVRDGAKVLCADWRRGLVGVGGECGLEIWKFGEKEMN
jgi:ribosome biogenesis protein YTM1